MSTKVKINVVRLSCLSIIYLSIYFLHFHDDHEAFLPIVCVFVDIHDVDDVFTATGLPVKINFTSGFHAVFQNLQSTLLSSLQILAPDNFPTDAEPENIVGTVFQGYQTNSFTFSSSHQILF